MKPRFLRLLYCLAFTALLPSTALASPAPELPRDLSFETQTTLVVPGEPQWESMLDTARSVLKAAHARYEGASGTVWGFYPGSPYYYPDEPIPFYFYARDTATILPAARYFFDDASLRTSIEEHLWLQYSRTTQSVDGDLGVPIGAGAISATISPALKVNKATVVSDEETSLVHAAYRYYLAAGGADWLRRDLSGRSVLDRLNAAMDWLLERRVHPQLGLVVRAHTTDWGDVKQEPGANPTDVGANDAWTYSIYDQALAFAALMELSEMNRAAGQFELSDFYYSRAQALRQRTDELLWMPERQYFRIHGHVSPELEHSFDEDEIVSIGNAAALYYGLATRERAPGIVRALERARVEARAYKPGLTLHPPYPAGAFANSAMAPRSYQNGAIWDWWGGRQIMGEFLSGNARLATEHLALVARDWATHPGKVREWESPWLGRVSDDYRYAGAAAVMAEALIEGLFGVSISHNRVRLEPRLGIREGYVRAYQEAGNIYVAYQYRYASGEIELRVGTNSPGIVPVRVLLPEHWTVDPASPTVNGLIWSTVYRVAFGGAVDPSVTVDSQPVPSHVEWVGSDAYVVLEIMPGKRVVTIKPAATGQSSSSAS